MEGSKLTDGVQSSYECQTSNCDWSGIVREMDTGHPLSGDVERAYFCPSCGGRIFLTLSEGRHWGKVTGLGWDE